MGNADIRWVQRFSNYKKALAKLGEVVDSGKVEQLSDLEKEGLVQRFEYTYELAWKTLQDLLRKNGYVDIAGPNVVLQQAFQDGYIEDADSWRRMKKSRELSSHTYDSKTAEEIVRDIAGIYYPILRELAQRLNNENNDSQPNIFS